MTAVDAVGTEPTGAINGVIGNGVTVFLTKVVTVTRAEVRAGIIRIQIGAASSRGEVGAIHTKRRARDPR